MRLRRSKAEPEPEPEAQQSEWTEPSEWEQIDELRREWRRYLRLAEDEPLSREARAAVARKETPLDVVRRQSEGQLPGVDAALEEADRARRIAWRSYYEVKEREDELLSYVRAFAYAIADATANRDTPRLANYVDWLEALADEPDASLRKLRATGFQRMTRADG